MSWLIIAWVDSTAQVTHGLKPDEQALHGSRPVIWAQTPGKGEYCWGLHNNIDCALVKVVLAHITEMCIGVVLNKISDQFFFF